MPKHKVLIAPMTLTGVPGPYLDALQQADFEIVSPPNTHQFLEDEVIQALDGVVATLAGSEPYTPRVLAANPQLKVIARVGVGYDAVNVEAATKQGVAVLITPGTNQESVAEHAFGLIISVARSLTWQHEGIRAGKWPRRTVAPLREQTIGILGMGRIGKAVAVRARAFRMNVIAFDAFPDEAFAKEHDVKMVPLDELFSTADYVSLHVPHLPETNHLICRDTLKLMKPTAFLINTSRGGVVCEADLIEALKSKQIAGAGLDVFEAEPPPWSELFELDDVNLVFAAHTAGMDWKSRDDMAYSAAKGIVDLSRGEWPAEKIVNPEVREVFHFE